MASQRAIVSRNGFNSQILDADTLLSGSGIDASIAQPFAVGAVNANALNLSKVGALTTVLGNFRVNGTFNGGSIAGGFDNTTALAAAFTTNTGEIAWVTSVEAAYEFIAADARTPNGWTVIAAAGGGTAGNWILASSSIRLPPAGAGLDDWANFKALHAAVADSTVLAIPPPELILAGSYEVRTSQVLDNRPVKIRGTAQTQITMFLAPSGVQTASAFYWVNVPSGVGNTTLNGNATVGARTLVVTSGALIPNGTIIQVRQTAAPGLLLSYFTVISGGGTNTLTLDRPIVYPFLTGNTVSPTTSIPTGQIIEGNGMTISGTGDRAIELIASRNCLVTDVKVGTGLSDSGISLDLGSYSGNIERCFVDMGNTVTTFGIMLETAEACTLKDSVALRCGSAGIFMVDSVQSIVEGCNGYACVNIGAVGGYFGTSDGAANPAGNVSCRIFGCVFNDNTTGVVCGANTTCSWIGCTSSKSTGTDNWSIGGGQGTLSCQWTNCISEGGLGAAVNGWNFDTTNVKPQLTSIVANNAPGAGVGLAISCPEFYLNGFTSLGCAGGSILTAATVQTAYLNSMEITGPTVGAVSVINAVLGNGSRLFIKSCRIDFTVAGSVGINQTGAGSIVELQDVEVNGGGVGFGYNGNANTVFRRLGRLNVSGTAVPITAVEPDQGTFVANGAAAVAVPFRDLRAGAYVSITRNVNGGAPGIMPFYTLVPGTGFTATSVAGDTSTYGFKIMD